MVPSGTEWQYIVRAPRPAETWRGCALRRLFQHGGSIAVRAGQNVAQPLNGPLLRIPTLRRPRQRELWRRRLWHSKGDAGSERGLAPPLGI